MPDHLHDGPRRREARAGHVRGRRDRDGHGASPVHDRLPDAHQEDRQAPRRDPLRRLQARPDGLDRPDEDPPGPRRGREPTPHGPAGHAPGLCRGHGPPRRDLGRARRSQGVTRTPGRAVKRGGVLEAPRPRLLLRGPRRARLLRTGARVRPAPRGGRAHHPRGRQPLRRLALARRAPRRLGRRRDGLLFRRARRRVRHQRMARRDSCGRPRRRERSRV